MKYLFILILTSISLINCASVKSESKDYPFIEQEFHAHVDNFIKDSKGSLQKRDLYMTSLEFGNLKEYGNTVVGVCFPNPFGSKIKIDTKWWEQHPDYLEREQLIYHELGHCSLLRMHVKPSESEGFYAWLERLTFRLGIKKDLNLLPDSCPVSYMHPYTLDQSCISAHYDFYIEELFNRADAEEYKNKLQEDMGHSFWDEY